MPENLNPPPAPPAPIDYGPVHCTFPKFVCQLPAGATILTMGLKIIVVVPGWPGAYELTPSGMVLLSSWPAISFDKEKYTPLPGFMPT